MWPGYAENSRVLKWIFDRCDGCRSGTRRQLPAEGAIDTSGVKVDAADLKTLTSVDKEGWKAELPLMREHFATFGAKLPKALSDELAALEQRLG
jgi:phosphoenolpyruvate carboxykinase (GTP)